MTGTQEPDKATDLFITVGAAQNRLWTERTFSPRSPSYTKAVKDLTDLLAKDREAIDVFLELQNK